MKIKGNLAEYDVVAESYGWSYARAYVRVGKKFLGIIPYKSTLYSTSSSPLSSYPMTLVRAERMLKEDMIKWFEFAVEEYETYKLSWDGEKV